MKGWAVGLICWRVLRAGQFRQTRLLSLVGYDYRLGGLRLRVECAGLFIALCGKSGSYPR